MDKAFRIRNHDVVYMDRGYHPVVCGSGTLFYRVTAMAGPFGLLKSN